MNEKTVQVKIEEHYQSLRAERDASLKKRLARDRSFEELLAELSSLAGFNVEERAQAYA